MTKNILALVAIVFATITTGCGKRENSSGKLELQHGVIYEGQIVNGKANGLGEMRLPDGGVIAGVFENNKMTDGEIYQVSLKTDLGTYKGGWQHNAFEGKGTMKNDKGTYTGDWKNGMMDGEGIFKDPNGTITQVVCVKNNCN